MVPAWSCAGAVNDETTRSAGFDVTEIVLVLAAILLDRSISIDRVAAVGVGDHVIGPGQAIGDREGHLVGVRATGVERTGVGRRPDRDLGARVQGRGGREVEGVGPRDRNVRAGGHQGQAGAGVGDRVGDVERVAGEHRGRRGR